MISVTVSLFTASLFRNDSSTSLYYTELTLGQPRSSSNFTVGYFNQRSFINLANISNAADGTRVPGP